MSSWARAPTTSFAGAVVVPVASTVAMVSDTAAVVNIAGRYDTHWSVLRRGSADCTAAAKSSDHGVVEFLPVLLKELLP